ncbi:hypothetical protein GOB94_02275 [Granulicella sp. 5B5]|uniref:hypothetical protein n=1 Tax=Granulicella sp. 5B5 TaxID=1617967 RepID=UPI0015F49991|nr:hypothetical protein [Granulicella sp. 5B5]QMV17659.1 hypothetical protein GOB94_02275 [Granulicella sp. 5B5]
MRIAAFRPKGKLYPFVRTFGAPATLGVCLLLSAGAHASPDAKAIALHKYETLKTRVMGNDLTVNWAEFRTVAVDAGMESSFDWHPTRARVLKDLDAGNTESALAGAQTVIAHNMANPEGHLLAMMVYQQLGLESAADREHSIVDAIVKSIMSTGDGLSVQRALSTVSASEEEFVVNMVLDADTESQASVQKDGESFDRRTVRSEDGAEHVLWFHSSVQPVAVAANVLPQ